MKFLLWGLFAFATLAHAQGTVTDIDGNTYDYLTYGTQQWTVENAAMETYRDGTPIPQVTDATQWSNLTTGAWCYYDNDPTKGKLYNWYAVAGIHDNDPNTPNKEFAPEGWHVPTDAEWTTLEEYLIANGYNYDGTTTGNKIAKAMASTTGWLSSTNAGTPGNNQLANNSSNFNIFPHGYRNLNGVFYEESYDGIVWSSTVDDPTHSWNRIIYSDQNSIIRNNGYSKSGSSVRFIKDSNTCSEASINASATEVCAGEGVDLSVISSLTSNNIIYQNNFNNGLGLEWSNAITSNFSSHPEYSFVLGTFDSGAQPIFNLMNIDNGVYNISFDLLIIGTWDGDGNNGPDILSYNINGSNVFNATFSNLSTELFGYDQEQSYPNNYGAGINPAGSGSELIALGFGGVGWTFDNGCSSTGGAAVLKYSISNQVIITDGVINMEIFKNTGQSMCDESWALDNLVITQVNANSSTYTWSTGDTTENITVTPSETTEYWVDVTTNGVTCREYVTINVTAPAAPTGPLTQSFCDTATIADLTATGDNIQWYDAATGGNLLDSTTALTDGQTVYASQTVNGCESTDRLEVTVSIQNITITASATEVCAGETINITAQSLGLLLDNKFCFKDEIPITLHDSLLGAWPFCGNPNDVSGNNFNGTINGGVSLGESRFGDVNDSYIFDGQPLTYISMGTHEVFDITQGSISISAWVNSIGAGGTRTIVSKANSPNNFTSGTYHLKINTLNQIEYINTNYTNSNGWYSIASNPINLDGQWQHIIAISDIDNLKLKLFIDGQLVSEIDWEGTYKGGLQELLIGSHFKTDFGSQYMYNFNGSIDDVAIWNRVLNQHEIDYLSMTNSSTYIWSTGDTTETISVTPTETTEYWVDVTTNGVTCREYVTIDVTAPLAPTGDSEQTFCEASTVADLTATGDNIQWYDAVTGGNLLDSITALTDGQTVYASQTVNGCESTDRLEVTVSIQDITITASATEVCAGESVDLTVSTGLTAGSTACTSADLPANLQTGLVGYWPFCGNADDESGNGNNGTVNGATLTTDRFGNQDSAYIFEINDSFINIGSDNLLQFSNDFSYSVKFLVNEITLGSDCTAGSNITLNNEGLYEIGVDCNGILSFAIANDDPSWSWIPITSILINQWYDVTFTYNQGVVEIFIDGNLIYNYNGSGSLTDYHPNLNDLRLGDRQLHDILNVQTSSFNGKIDDVVLWNRALTPSEIQQLANSSTYNWSTGDTTANISVTPTETTEYWVDVTTNGVTCREYVTITVNDLPEAPTGETVNYFINCDSFSPTLNDVIATLTGDNIKLYDAAVGGNLLDPNSNIIDGQVVYASQTLDSCESSDRLEVQLNLYTLDTPVTDAPNNTVSFCNEQNLTILDLAPAQTATDRLWYETATSTIPIPETTPLVDGVTYYVSNYDIETGCESDRLAMTVEINNPEAPTGDAVQSFCDNVTVSDLSATGSNIQWYDAATGGNVLDSSSALSDGQLLYASQTENGCESITRLEVSVEIDIIPDPILITTELEFCLAREATLTDLEVDEQGFALEWYDSFSGGNMLPMDTLLEDGASYYATLYDAVSGCESLMRLEVVPTVIPCEVVIYNAISLNDNGMNDYMVIENAEYFPDNSLEIYNRDGHLLYSQTQYGIGDNFFRGIANVSGIYGSTLSGDGPRLPTGSYLYVFKYFNPYEQQEYTLKGFLTINSN